ncbi:MAG: hypothetical protein K2H82_04465, partial [Oscillospiraceae bacterium]|nr:hypothetical protein [Oscillospiraceae bacterium]
LQRDCQRRSDSRTENQMSEWHPAWQEKYPLHQREVVFKKGDQVFRADICRKERREIIEFQHSRITNKDFHARNNFYNSIGYKVIWLFEFDQLNGKYQFMHPDQYDKFINDFVRNGQKVYVMDQNTYYSMFAEWKPQQNRKVSVYFMRTYQQWKFYSHIECVTGSFDYDMPMRLFVRDIKESDFLSRIGIKNNRI